jgi:Caspase domain
MTKRALLLASGAYTSPLSELRSATPDTERLGAILAKKEVGDFETKVVLNPSLVVAQCAIQDLLESADDNDLTLIYLSGHGVKDAYGRFYLALPETNLRALASTALSGRFMREQLADTACKRLVFVLDTCFAGAFSRDLIAKSVTIASGVPQELTESQGHAVISATSAVQYAFETMSGEPTSLFTKAICEGLETGSADLDEDGWVSLEDLFNFTVTKMREEARPQTPEMSVLGLTAPILIARASMPHMTPNLDPDVSVAITSVHDELRLAGAKILADYAVSLDRDRSSWARTKLRELGNDINSEVKEFVSVTLGRPFRPHGPSYVQSLNGVLPLVGNEWITVSGESLRTCTKRIADFASFEGTVAATKSIAFISSDSTLEILATDRYRLDWHRFTVLSSGPKPFVALVSADDYPSVLDQLPDDDVCVIVSEGDIQFSFEYQLLSVERVRGTFPRYDKLVQSIGPTVCVETTPFLDKVESVVGNISEPSFQSIILRFPSDSDSMLHIINGDEENASIEACVDASGSMDGLEMRLNAGYLLSALDTYDEKFVYLGVGALLNNTAPFLLLNDREGTLHRHAIAPMQLPQVSKALG